MSQKNEWPEGMGAAAFAYGAFGVAIVLGVAFLWGIYKLFF